MGHRHAMYINVLKSMLMYIACLCPNLVSVHFYAIPIYSSNFLNFLFTCILKGMSCGFHIGVDRTKLVRRARRNLPSVKTHLTLVADGLIAESEAGHLLVPLPEPLAMVCRTSPLGLIPKPHQLGKWRLIVDLSSLQGRSVKSPELCHL